MTNNEIRLVKSLSMKKCRDEEGLFVVEGEKMVQEALSSSFKVEKVFRIEDIGEDTMRKITQLASPSPVLAIVRERPDTHLEDNLSGENKVGSILDGNGLFLALDTLRDPGNLGTVIRIADWFGIKAVFASADTVDLYNPKVVQATMGAIFRVSVHYTGLSGLCKEVFARKGKVYGTFLDGENIYRRDLSTGNDSPVVVVTGNESVGISPQLASLVSDRLYIPPYPSDNHGSESLNAAIATAITIAEFRRRI